MLTVTHASFHQHTAPGADIVWTAAPHPDNPDAFVRINGVNLAGQLVAQVDLSTTNNGHAVVECRATTGNPLHVIHHDQNGGVPYDAEA